MAYFIFKCERCNARRCYGASDMIAEPMSKEALLTCNSRCEMPFTKHVFVEAVSPGQLTDSERTRPAHTSEHVAVKRQPKMMAGLAV